MGNPVNAFLQGFAAVDRLETNRAQRAFLAEKQSWLRQTWEQRNEEYQYQKLERYKETKGAEFNAETQGIMQRVTADIDAAEARGDMKEAKFLRDMFFGADSTQLIQEAVNNMIARDPQFGELVSLGLGKDAAAGPLVRDPKQPVSGIGILAARSDFGGGIYVEIDGVHGKAPLTEHRTASPNDRVFLAQAGKAELVSIFGPKALGNEWDIMQVLRSELNIDKPTGELPGQREASAKVDTAKAAADKVGREPTTEEELLAQDEATVGVGVAGFREEAGELIERNEDGSLQYLGQRDYVEEGLAEPPPVLKTAKEVGRTGKDLVVGGAKGVAALAKGGVTDTVDTLKDIGEGFAKGSVGQFLSGLTGIGDGATAEVPPPTPGAIGEAAKTTGTTPTVAESTANSPTTQDVVDRTPGLTSEQATQTTAANLVNRTSTSRPPPEEVYKAYMMAKAGYLTLPEVIHFKRTGRFNEPARVKLEKVTTDGVTTWFDPYTGQPVSRSQTGNIGGSGDEPATVQDQQRVLNLLQDSTAGLYDDNPRGQQQFIDSAEGAFTLMGLPGNTKAQLDARANPANMNLLQQGGQLIRGFDEDLVQLVDLPPPFDPDFKVHMNAGNLALASTLAANGVVGAKEGTWALRSYLEQLKPVVGESDGQFIQRANQIESAVNSSTDTFTVNGKTLKIDRSQPKHKVREEIIEFLISSRE